MGTAAPRRVNPLASKVLKSSRLPECRKLKAEFDIGFITADRHANAAAIFPANRLDLVGTKKAKDKTSGPAPKNNVSATTSPKNVGSNISASNGHRSVLWSTCALVAKAKTTNATIAQKGLYIFSYMLDLPPQLHTYKDLCVDTHLVFRRFIIYIRHFLKASCPFAHLCCSIIRP